MTRPSVQKTTRRISLNAAEQRAMLWLLVASDNGAIISGARDENVAALYAVGNRIREAIRGN